MLANQVETLVQLFHKRMDATPFREAYREKREGQWVGTTWRAFGNRAQEIAAGFAEAGLKRGDTVAILGSCRPEWVMVDMGALLVGAHTVGIYESLLADQARFILEDSGSKILVVQGQEQFEKLRPLLDQVESLELLVAWDYEPKSEEGITTLGSLMSKGAELQKEKPDALKALSEAVEPADVAVIVYTSGTTGQPKGVPLTHQLIVSWMRNTQNMLLDEIEDEDITMSFLPYAHVAEHVSGFFGRMNIGLNSAYATSYETLLDEVQEIRPTYFGAVPRIFEKFYGRIREEVAKRNPRRQAIFKAAQGLARRRARAQLGGPPLSWKDKLFLPLVDRVVYRKIREVFGGRVKIFITGSAPIDVEILEFFFGCGMRISEVYGLSESCAIAFANTEGNTRLGTVGKVLPGVEYKIAEDGEILLRGSTIFSGYLNRPEENAAAFDEEGYFRTGDIGEIDADGYLRITDRKKSLIKTAGGKYVVPARLEMFVKEEPAVGQVYVHGDRKPFVVALVTLDDRERERLAEEVGAAQDQLHAHPQIQGRIAAAVERANGKLARFEQIKRHAILPEDFSIEENTLTATMKIRRKVVAEKYADQIERLYSEATAAHQQHAEAGAQA